jgi:hypothetical protein
MSTKLVEGMLVNTGVAAVAAAVVETAYGLAMASLTSATMILPDGPVPYSPARETPLELARFWARGLAKILDPEATTGAETGVAGVGVVAAGVGAAA